MTVTPFRVMMALSVHIAGRHARANWPPSQWDSPAGKDARAWLLAEGLMTDSGDATDRLDVWVRSMLRAPMPPKAGARREVA